MARTESNDAVIFVPLIQGDGVERAILRSFRPFEVRRGHVRVLGEVKTTSVRSSVPQLVLIAQNVS